MEDDPIVLVRSYLTASGERRLEEAAGYLAPDALIVFPNGQFQDLNEMASSMGGRYRSIGKTHQTWDTAASGSDTVVVTTGTLHGVNTQGVPFEGIRFCDRFVIRDGRIAEQHVWNDLAESGVLDRS
jgi:hypothetical protein